MVDITAKLFWCRLKELCEKMADKLNDVVYTDDSKETVDVINLLLLGWILLGLAVYIIGNIVANHLRKKKESFPPSEVTADEKPETSDHISCVSETNEAIIKEPEKVEKTVLIPTCTGDDIEIVEWINNVFLWLYNQRIISPVIESWLTALNARTRLSSTDHGILVDFKNLIPSSAPVFQDVIETYSIRGDMILIGQVEMQDMAFEVVITQIKEKDKITIPFILNLKKLSSKMTIDCIPEELTFITRFSELPQIELSVEPDKENTDSNEDNQLLIDVVNEIATEAFSFSIINLKFSHFSECPRLMQRSPHSEAETLEPSEKDNEEQLLVKIIKATNLGGSEGCLKPYCVVEMDEPPQKFETREVEEQHNPFWDESFVFTVKDISAELLFEIYDKAKPSKENFLGLGIVGVDELIRNPSQRQIIPLQSRPLEDDNVTGSLTTEFLFLNQSTPVSETTHLGQPKKANDVLVNSDKTVETNSRITAGGTIITTTTIKRTKEEKAISLEASSNLNSNSISNHFTEQILTLLPGTKEEQAQICSKTSAFNKANAVSQEINGNCKMYDTNNHVDNLPNGKNELNRVSEPRENGFIIKLSPCNKVSSNNMESVIKENNEGEVCSEDSKENKPILENSLKPLDNACIINEIKHEDDENKIPLILVSDNQQKDNGVEPLPNNELKYDNKMHDEILNNCMCSPLNNDYTYDMSIESLPTIPENLEVNVTSPRGLENNMDGEADLTGTALKELEKQSKPTPPSKSTLIIHSVQRPDSSISESLEASPASHMSKESHTSYSESVPSSPSQERNGDDRSRPKEKKTFMGTLRRKLSFRKQRSRSAEHQSESASSYSHGSSRSASTDRMKHATGQKPSPFRTGKFMGRRLLAVPGSTRSSLSEASGISASSSRTYINENSTLVVETNENGIIKRYLIPNSLIHQSKWTKRGTKLHIYNDHVFVAKHLSGSTPCQVCKKYLTRRPGKQGYECRGCSLQCHKSCHVKVITFCSNSTINSMEVEYIQDPKGATPKSI